MKGKEADYEGSLCIPLWGSNNIGEGVSVDDESEGAVVFVDDESKGEGTGADVESVNDEL